MLAEAQRTVSGLTRGISRPDAKSDRTYRYFLGGADWSAIDLAHHVAAFVFDQLDVGAGDEVLVHVDDTFIGKTGDATDGVAELYNPAEGELEQGNKFVTSCIQVGEVYVSLPRAHVHSRGSRAELRATVQEKDGDRRRGDRHAAPTGSWSGSHRRLRFRVLRRQACYDDPRTGSRCRLSLHIEQPCLAAG